MNKFQHPLQKLGKKVDAINTICEDTGIHAAEKHYIQHLSFVNRDL